MMGSSKTVTVIACLSFTIVAVRQVAGGEAVPTHPEKGPVVEVPKSRWSGDTGVNFVNAYYAYGILQEDKGVIAQPFADVFYTLFEGDGLITKAAIGLQLWASIHSEETLAAGNNSLRAWYEQDIDIPVAITFRENTTLTVSYLEYRFPNGALALERSVSANISYDDTKLLGAAALHPRATVLYNFEGSVGIVKSNAWYLELGISPGFVIAEKSSFPVTVSVPVTVGIGDSHFYPDEAFGFLSVGPNASIPLNVAADASGRWTMNAGVAYQIFGAGTAAFNLKRQAYVLQIGIKRDF
jgi:hypothetical protein